MTSPWFLGAWDVLRIAELVNAQAPQPDVEDLEDTTPTPRGEVYRPAVQAPAGTGAVFLIDYETPGD